MATDIKQQALEKHYEWQGKIEVVAKAPVNTKRGSFALPIRPVLHRPCLEIEKGPLTSCHTS